MGLNKILLIGHLGKDVEMRTTQSGKTVANFSLAVSEKSKGEEKTEWFRVTAFDKLADICGKYLSKGKQVYVEGRIQTREWQDKDGNKRTSVDVIANSMQMLGGKGEGQQGAPAPKDPQDDDDIPF